MDNIYTQENWKLFLKTYFPDCKSKSKAYELLAKELGMEAASIERACMPSNELPTWAKAFIFAFINSKNVTKELVVSEVIERIKNSLDVYSKPIICTNQTTGEVSEFYPS